MKVLGVSGSPRKDQSTDRLVQEVLGAAVGVETEFISLAGKQIGACISCLGCLKDNICKVNDDMGQLRQKIVEADAYVIGGATYYGMINGLAHCFLERFYQFRHREGKAVVGKLGVAVGIGGGSGDPVLGNIESFFQFNQIESVGAISAQGAANCFTCGQGETCKVGVVHMFMGPERRLSRRSCPVCTNKPRSWRKRAR